MDVSPVSELLLKLASGSCWIFVYLLMIRRAATDQVAAIPWPALCANLAWEFYYTFVQPHAPPQSLINGLWFILDLVILWQVLRFGPKEFKGRERRYFYELVGLGLVLSGVIVLGIDVEFGDSVGRYAAFGMNLMMSALFIGMLLQRGSVDGQSMYIALLKLVGTLFASLLFGMHYPESTLLSVLYVGILILDGIYLKMVHDQCIAQDIYPWRRL